MIVCLLVLGTAAAVTIVLIILFLRRRQGQKSLDSFDNQLYERQEQTSGSINVSGDTKDNVGDDTPHEYAAISADDAAYYEEMNVSLTP